MIQRNMHSERASRLGRHTRRVVVLLALVGMLGSAGLCKMRYNSEKRRFLSAFNRQAEAAVFLIRREVNQVFDVLESVELLHTLSADISAQAFTEFVQKGMDYQVHMLGSFGLAPRVGLKERAAYEKAMRQTGRPAYQVMELDNGGYVEAEARDHYFPISYRVSEDRDLPVGYDLAADAANRAAMERAVATDRVCAGGWLPAKTDGRQRMLFSAMERMYPGAAAGADPLTAVDGFAFAVLDTHKIMERALQQFSEEGIVVLLYDRNQLIFPEEPPVDVDEESAVRYEAVVQAGGLDWSLVCLPTQAFMRTQLTGQPWLLLGGGLLLTGLIVLQWLQLAGQADRVARTVDQRTQELRRTNAELAEEIRQRHRLQSEIIAISTQEKMRVGRDLHDSLGQQLTGVGLMASGLARALEQSGHETAEQARQLAEQLKEARQLTRRMARGLSPVELDAEGLPDALQRLAEDVQRVSGVCCSFHEAGVNPAHTQDQAVQVYHLVQEALNNAVRHSAGTELSITLDEKGICVCDNGCGMPEHSPETGLGLKIMQYRAEMANGTLHITSRPQGGTQVIWEVNSKVGESSV